MPSTAGRGRASKKNGLDNDFRTPLPSASIEITVGQAAGGHGQTYVRTYATHGGRLPCVEHSRRPRRSRLFSRAGGYGLTRRPRRYNDNTLGTHLASGPVLLAFCTRIFSTALRLPVFAAVTRSWSLPMAEAATRRPVVSRSSRATVGRGGRGGCTGDGHNSSRSRVHVRRQPTVVVVRASRITTAGAAAAAEQSTPGRR